MTIHIKGIVQGQRVSVPVDSGATHNFMDAQVVQRRGLAMSEFEGFFILVSSDVPLSVPYTFPP